MSPCCRAICCIARRRQKSIGRKSEAFGVPHRMVDQRLHDDADLALARQGVGIDDDLRARPLGEQEVIPVAEHHRVGARELQGRARRIVQDGVARGVPNGPRILRPGE